MFRLIIIGVGIYMLMRHYNLHSLEELVSFVQVQLDLFIDEVEKALSELAKILKK